MELQTIDNLELSKPKRNLILCHIHPITTIFNCRKINKINENFP